MTFFTMLVPLLLAALFLYGGLHKVDVYSAILKGAREGISVVVGIFPALVGLLTGVTMLRASGALDCLATMLAPCLHWVGIPSELVPLMLIRPLSGSGALSVGAELMETYGADSLVGRTAAVMLGSTETTFYTVAVYFGAVGITKTRYAIPAALCADLTSFCVASWVVRWLF